MAIYLDYNATAPMRPQVKERMQALLGEPLNASSVHAWGRKARGLVEASRKTIAEALNCFPDEVIFCGSGTEANNAALGQSVALASAVEHASVLKTGAIAGILPVDMNGVVEVAALDSRLHGNDNFLLSVMLANNETGVIQPIEEVVRIAKQKGALVHCDAVQAWGKVAVDFSKLGVDMMTVSAHKMGGPVGAAALIVRRGLDFKPLLAGGGQESNRRAGTENVAAIVGFAKAVELMDLAQMETLRGWMEMMERELAGATVLGKNVSRLPNTSCIAMPGVGAETQLIAFDLEGIAVSAGSACTSGRIEPSHVLKAMGIEEKMAASAIRVSGGWNTTESDIKAFASAWKKLYERGGKRTIS